MRKKIAILPLLLVGVIFAGHAHGGRLPTSGARSAGDNFKDTANAVVDQEVEDNLPSATTKRSVVYNWSLVCEQLCGAGLGGPLCGPQCTNITLYPENLQKDAADHLIGTDKDSTCKTLCRFELGGSACLCKPTRDQFPPRDLDRNTICSTFCMANSITVQGCSPCATENSVSNPPNSNHFMAAGNDESHPGPYEDDTLRNSTASTTPDWNEVCLSLCKIGEGGALCNCDLPPFF